MKSTTISEPSLYHDYAPFPLGFWKVEANENGIVSIVFTAKKTESKPNKITDKSLKQLQEYFNKKRIFFDLPLEIEGYSTFYQQVWSALREIPFAKTVSYQDISININNPKAVRAVGMANGKNPIAVVIPCHRVIGKNRKLTGYAWGLEVKEWLLKHEGAIMPQLTLF